MNKLVKGSIAAGAAAILLLGGAGTFALWSDSQAINGGTVETGTLDIGLNGTAAWSDISPDAANTDWDPINDRLVPGDTVTLTQSVDITARGKNLDALLSYTPADSTVAPALAGLIDVTLEANQVGSGDSATITPGVAPNTFIITPGTVDAPSTFEVVITIAFDPATTNQVGQDITGVNLSATAFNLQQVR